MHTFKIRVFKNVNVENAERHGRAMEEILFITKFSTKRFQVLHLHVLRVLHLHVLTLSPTVFSKLCFKSQSLPALPLRLDAVCYSVCVPICSRNHTLIV